MPKTLISTEQKTYYFQICIIITLKCQVVAFGFTTARPHQNLAQLHHCNIIDSIIDHLEIHLAQHG